MEEDTLFTFGNVFYSDVENYEKLEEKTFEVKKNGVKTVIICKFNKDGWPISISYTAEKQQKIKPKPT